MTDFGNISETLNKLHPDRSVDTLKTHVHHKGFILRAELNFAQKLPNSENNPRPSSLFPQVSLFFALSSFVQYPQLRSTFWVDNRTHFHSFYGYFCDELLFKGKTVYCS